VINFQEEILLIFLSNYFSSANFRFADYTFVVQI